MYKRDSAHQGLERLQGTEFFTEYNRKKKRKKKKKLHHYIFPQRKCAKLFNNVIFHPHVILRKYSLNLNSLPIGLNSFPEFVTFCMPELRLIFANILPTILEATNHTAK